VFNAVEERFRVPLRGWQARGVLGQDAVLAAAFTVLGFLPVLAANGLQLGRLPVHQAGLPAVLLGLAQCLPLAVRRRRPALSLAVVACAFAAYQLLGYPASFTSVGVLLALYSAGAHEATFRRELVVGATASYVVLAVALDGLGSPQRPVDYVAFYLVLGACWGAGSLIRARQVRAEERRHQAVQQATELERAQIARELRAAVTQQVSGIVVQADAAHYLLPGRPGLVESGLTEISVTGRRALGELRYLLDVLDVPAADDRDESDSALTPVAAGLHDLVDQAQLAGQPVDLIEKGEPDPMSVSAELAAYRVVQEALTNAAKHAPGQVTLVDVRYGAGVSIEVTTDGPAVAPGSFVSGRGLTSLRERVLRCGGELKAGRRPGGGFSVRARIPAETTPVL
jgi:signal transduction histidine kinase